jgi:ribosomal protein S18 acetylase RimI-like enzyme
MVGIVEKKPPPIALDKKVLRQALGFLRGTIAYYGLKKFIVDKPYPFVQPPGSGSVEFVATAPHQQGRGAAFRLINHVMDATPYRDYVLEVVSGNAAAIHLYEKLGFAEFMRVPAPKRSGLGHFIYMKKAG